MRITVVSPYDPFPAASRDGAAHVGGVERVLGEVSKRLAERGHEVRLVCSGDRRAPPVEGLEVIRLRRTGVVMRAPIAPFASHLLPDSDVVHVPATYPFTTPTMLRKADRMGIPAVLDFHFEPDPGTAFGRLAARAYRAIGPPSYTLAEAVLIRSKAYADRSPSLNGIPARRRHIIPNGIDPKVFSPNGGAADDAPILFVGRLVPYKGLDILLTALSLMPHAPPLVIVGDGPLRGLLESMARRLRVDATFLGPVEDDALPDLYRHARLTVLPSITRQECFGISLLESMACGTPVVASDLPGVADVAAVGGLTAPAGDAPALARALVKALRPGVLPRGQALAAPVHAQYSWDAVTDRLVAVYEQVVETVKPQVPHAHPRSHPVL